MTEKYVFADVNLPFHVWVKEGNRWVLRDAASDLQNAAVNRRVERGTSSVPRADSPSRP
jgi:hypothetical protein